MEDDAEIWLSPGSPTSAERTAALYASIDNIQHASSEPRRVYDSVLKRGRQSNSSSNNSDSDKQRSKVVKEGGVD